MLTLLLIVFAEHHENTHKTKTLTINEDNERLHLTLCIITDPLLAPYLQFYPPIRDESLTRIESFHLLKIDDICSLDDDHLPTMTA